MALPIAAIIGGAAIGGAINYFSQQEAARSTNQASKEISNDQMRFQERMSNTAHLREIADLKAAGLNPILSSGGSGASTPAGSQAANMAMPAIQMPSVLEVVSLMQEQQKIDMQRDVVDAQIPNTKAKTQNVKADTVLKGKGAIRAGAEGTVWEILNKTLQKVQNPKNYPKLPKSKTGIAYP